MMTFLAFVTVLVAAVVIAATLTTIVVNHPAIDGRWRWWDRHGADLFANGILLGILAVAMLGTALAGLWLHG